MRYEARSIDLIPSKTLVVRSPEEADAAELLDYFLTACGETDFLLCRPHEVTFTVEKEREMIASHLAHEKRMLIAVFDGKRIIADIGIQAAGDFEKYSHRCRIGISVRSEYWGHGIGSLLLSEAEKAARSMGYKQLELDVFAVNSRAVSLYKKAGFTECGRIPRAAHMLDGSYSDLIYMIKQL
ncbi:MAG: GNAT family N-acetyltransferase [Treponema sp.]|nr:GNAT family N-acetyltransferase [Treponema sp.]